MTRKLNRHVHVSWYENSKTPQSSYFIGHTGPSRPVLSRSLPTNKFSNPGHFFTNCGGSFDYNSLENKVQAPFRGAWMNWQKACVLAWRSQPPRRKLSLPIRRYNSMPRHLVVQSHPDFDDSVLLAVPSPRDQATRRKLKWCGPTLQSVPHEANPSR